ncbi:MAG: hypothetical protein JNM58_04015 [Xanthomonadaceae bacterium]|nr:hypothetical protein [Xanthomonadaceae bacterium]
MQYGAGWIVLENLYPEPVERLVSVVSPRRSSGQVAQLIEQLYVDRHGSIRERLEYKKSPKNYPYRTHVGLYSGVMHCGQSPVLHAVYAHKISLKDGLLDFTYKVLVREESGHIPVFEDRRRTIAVDV